MQPGTLASGVIDKVGTTLTLYRDGTFTTRGLFRTSEPDRLVGFSSDIDSMRRKSVTGRGAAFVVTGGMSILASNNRGVCYVTVIGQRSGTQTYTSKNPENRLLSSIRSLQAAADHLLKSPPAVVSAPPKNSSATTPQSGEVATQLKMLAELHATGALADDEFAAAKARILTSPESTPTEKKPGNAAVATTNVRCHRCRHVQKVPVDQRTFVCAGCGSKLQRRTESTG